MHILFISDLDTKYGAPQGLWQMVAGLRKYYPSVRITVVVPKGVRSRDRKDYKQRAKEFHMLGCSTAMIQYGTFQILRSMPFINKVKRWLRYYWGATIGIRELVSQINMDQVDIIHSNSTREDLGARLSQRYHKPLIWHIREFGDLDYQVMSIRANYVDYMNRCADLFISVSDVVRDHWICKGVDEGRIKTIYDGVDEMICPKKERIACKNEKIKFIMLGVLHKTKGHDHLIEALGRLDSTLLGRYSVDIVGGVVDQHYFCYLQERIAALKLENTVRFLGYQENFRQKLSAYDCGLMCSNAEAFGFVTVEYMAAGLPVIAAATGANPEIVRDGKVGYLYDPQDPNGLANKIETIIRNPVLCAKLGREASRYARERFSIQESIFRIYSEYENFMMSQFAGGGGYTVSIK